MKIPLILIPGILCDDFLWARQISALSDIAECEVADITQDDRIEAMAARILNQAPTRFALGGLSLGGMVAQEIMRQAPDRVEKLALIDTNARTDTPEQRQANLALIEAVKIGVFKGATPRMLARLIHPDRLEEEGLPQEVMAMTQRVGRDAYIRQQTAATWRVDGREDLRRISIPTLLLCGRQDVISPPKVHVEMAERIPHAELVIIEECGHLAPMERPEEVGLALRKWLES